MKKSFHAEEEGKARLAKPGAGLAAGVGLVTSAALPLSWVESTWFVKAKVLFNGTVVHQFARVK